MVMIKTKPIVALQDPIRINKRYLLLLLTFILMYFNSMAQVTEAWVALYDRSWTDIANAIVLDDSGNVYVTGESYYSGASNDWATIKHNSKGDTVWAAIYNGPGSASDLANAIAVDDSGNVYVTGRSSNSTYDYKTVKYNANGDTLWTASYDGAGTNSNDEARDIAVDNLGNVYITGKAKTGNTYDYVTIKYNMNGDTMWTAIYYGSGSGGAEANALVLDTLGNVYVTGWSHGGSSETNYTTIKYDSSGAEQWVALYDGPGNWFDRAYAITIDYLGYVYVTGSGYTSASKDDYTTIKYSGSGTVQWISSYVGPWLSGDDIARDIAVDDSGNVYVTGSSQRLSGGEDYVTVKYDSSGAEQWVAEYNGTGNYTDRAKAVAVDNSGNVYVTGKSSNTGIGYDGVTIKYNSNGDTIWTAIYVNADLNDIAVDNLGNAFVTGEDDNEDGVTIKYCNNPPVAVASADTMICSGDSVVLSVSGGTEYLWIPNSSINDSTIANPIAFPSATTTYKAIVSNYCTSDTAFVTVIVDSTYSIIDPSVLICIGDSMLIYGYYRSLAGIYYDSLTTVICGSDSIHSTTLTVSPNYNISDLPISICDGDSVSIYGEFRNAPGTYYDSLTTFISCDSVHSTVLTVNPTYSYSDPGFAICNGDSTLIYGTYRTNAGTYYNSFTTLVGCDSIYSTVLTLSPTYSINDLPITVCNGDSVSIYGVFRSIAGTYYDSITTVDGCDSAHSTALTVNPIYDTIVTPVICQGDSVQLPGGIYTNATGIYYDTLPSAQGCDSAITTTLTVKPAYFINTLNDTICDGDSVMIFGTYRKTAGMYYDSVTTINGCDSVKANSLIVNPTYFINAPDETICEGDSILIFSVYQSTDGTYYDSLSTVNGCDSIIIATLNLNPIPTAGFTESSTGLDVSFVNTSPDTTMTLTYSWDFGDGTGTSTLPDPVYSYGSEGTYNVCLTITNIITGCVDIYCAAVTVMVTGLFEISLNSWVSIYPNPTTGLLILEIDPQRNTKLFVKLYHFTGRLIYSEEINHVTGNCIQQIDLSQHAKGMYHVQIVTDGSVINRKVVYQ